MVGPQFVHLHIGVEVWARVKAHNWLRNVEHPNVDLFSFLSKRETRVMVTCAPGWVAVFAVAGYGLVAQC